MRTSLVLLAPPVSLVRRFTLLKVAMFCLWPLLTIYFIIPPSDPLGLSKNIDQATFDAWRVSELKHGRICMLGVVGYVVQEVYRFPFEIAPGLKCADVPNGVAAINAIPALGWAQIFFLIGAVDYYGFLGNFPVGQKAVGKDDFEELQLNELQNGRLAMLGFLELLRHDSQNFVQPGFDGLDHLITGLPFLYN